MHQDLSWNKDVLYSKRKVHRPVQTRIRIFQTAIPNLMIVPTCLLPRLHLDPDLQYGAAAVHPLYGEVDPLVLHLLVPVLLHHLDAVILTVRIIDEKNDAETSVRPLPPIHHPGEGEGTPASRHHPQGGQVDGRMIHLLVAIPDKTDHLEKTSDKVLHIGERVAEGVVIMEDHGPQKGMTREDEPLSEFENKTSLNGNGLIHTK